MTSPLIRRGGLLRSRRSVVKPSGVMLSVLALAVLASTLPLAFVTPGCSKGGDAWARAKRITTRSDLIGGPGALGEVGDFLLENDRIRVVVQGAGFSRGFGVYGGGLIDADLQRPVTPAGQEGGRGQAQFGELFPVFFLQALVPFEVAVLSDGSDGGPARVITRGEGGDFLTLTKTLNQVILNSHVIDGDLLDPRTLNGRPNLEYETEYELRPGESFVRMTTRVVNVSAGDLEIPSPTARTILNLLFDDLAEFDVPIGTVLLFGDGNKVFTPGAGFDLRFTLHESYTANLSFPALPGIITPVLATASSNGVSYGFFVEPMDEGKSFVASRLNEAGQSVYEEVYDVTVGPDSMLVPFLASAFTGVFHGQAPRALPRGGSFEFTSFFSVGDGDVASAIEPMFEMRGAELGRVRGQVFDEQSLEPAEGASIVVLDAEGKPFSQMYARDGGRFRGKLPAGQYSALVERDPMISAPVPFTVVAGKTTAVDLASPTPARLAVTVLDEDGQRLPARVMVVGTVEPERAHQETRDWLFDLSLGQRWRPSSLAAEDASGDTPVRYIEGEAYTRGGNAVVAVRPGVPFRVYVARGIEYDLESFDLEPLRSGTTSVHRVTLRRTVDTGEYVASDLHLHASPSLDSDLDLEARVVSAAGEGLKFIAATDHNIITDYQPYIERAGLDRWLSSMRGVELTTLEAGHFNAYPLNYDAGDVVRGSPEWAHRPPQEIFDELRALGTHGPDETIIQVNHPRDSILGYFSQYKLDPLSAEIPAAGAGGALDAIISPTGTAFYDEDGESTFSFDFDAIEVLNGKRLDQLRSFRMPHDISMHDLDPEQVAELPPPGTVLCDDKGAVAWPGAVDDWFNFLNLGRRYTAIGNSDSHEDVEGTIGVARSYIWVGHDDPSRICERDIVRGIRAHRVILTNGPFVEMFVDGHEIGSEVVSETGSVDVRIRVQVANWVDVSRATLYGNGRPLDTFAVTPKNGLFEVTIKLELDGDTWLVVEVVGDRQLFPVYTPIEIPPVELNDVFATIAEPFGFAGGALGKILPNRMGVVNPYALTNPIWVDVGGDGFQAPGLPWRECVGYALVEDHDRRIEKMAPRPISTEDLLKPSIWFPRILGDIGDIRTYFDQFRD